MCASRRVVTKRNVCRVQFVPNYVHICVWQHIKNISVTWMYLNWRSPIYIKIILFFRIVHPSTLPSSRIQIFVSGKLWDLSYSPKGFTHTTFEVNGGSASVAPVNVVTYHKLYQLFPIDTFMVSYYIYGRHTQVTSKMAWLQLLSSSDVCVVELLSANSLKYKIVDLSTLSSLVTP